MFALILFSHYDVIRLIMLSIGNQ